MDSQTMNAPLNQIEPQTQQQPILEAVGLQKTYGRRRVVDDRERIKFEIGRIRAALDDDRCDAGPIINVGQWVVFDEIGVGATVNFGIPETPHRKTKPYMTGAAADT